MKLSKPEQHLMEAFDSLMSEPMLGLQPHKGEFEEMGQLERGLEYVHNQIREMFALRAAKLVHHEGICSAFSKVHNYKYLDDPSFVEAMRREMQAQAVPVAEQREATRAVFDVLSELKREHGVESEKDYGFHPDLDDVMKMPV
jgi:hypothetical protein